MARRLEVTYAKLKAEIAYQLVKGDITWNELKATQVDLNYYTLNRYFNDALALSETSSLNVAKNVSETLALSETQQITLGKQLSEALSLGDNFELVLQIFRDFSDSSAISDVSVLTVDKNLDETLTTTDLLTMVLNVSKADTVQVNDTPAFEVSKPLSESIGVADTFTRSATYSRAFTDVFSLDDTETHVNGAVINKANVFGFSDSNTFSFQKNATDSLSFSENFSHTIARHNHSVLNTSAWNTFVLNS